MLNNNFILLNDYQNEANKLSSFKLENTKSFNNKNIAKLLIILLLIININYFCKYNFSYRENEDNNLKISLLLNDPGSVMQNYSLYGIEKYEQITLLISQINDWNINDTSILNFIDNLQQQTLRDIQIIFILSNDSENSIVNLIKVNTQKDDRIEVIFPIAKEEFLSFYLMNLIKGKFIMIVEKFTVFDKKELENFFSLTKGKIDNIFVKQIQNSTFS